MVVPIRADDRKLQVAPDVIQCGIFRIELFLHSHSRRCRVCNRHDARRVDLLDRADGVVRGSVDGRLLNKVGLCRMPAIDLNFSRPHGECGRMCSEIRIITFKSIQFLAS